MSEKTKRELEIEKEIETLKAKMEVVEKKQDSQERKFLLYVQLTNPKVYKLLKETPE